MNLKGLTEREKISFRSLVNNYNGQDFERLLIMGCNFYRENKIAKIEKISEPFRVLKKKNNGRFEGVFTSNAELDFQGTVNGGSSIVFESKFTMSDRFKISVLTEQQRNSLEEHLKLGAYVFLAIGIKERYFFVPYEYIKYWEREEKKKSFSEKDLEKFEVFRKTMVGLDFLKKVFDL